MPKPILFPLTGKLKATGYGIGPFSGRFPLAPVAFAPLKVTKFGAYAVLHASPDETSVGVTKFIPYAVLHADPGENQVSVTKFGAYAVLNPDATTVGRISARGSAGIEVIIDAYAAGRMAVRGAADYQVVGDASATGRISARGAAGFEVVVDVSALGRASLRSSAEQQVVSATADPAVITKFNVYAVLNASPSETEVGVTKFGAYAVLDASPSEISVGVTKFGAYAVLNADFPIQLSASVTKFGAYAILNADFPIQTSVSVTKLNVYVILGRPEFIFFDRFPNFPRPDFGYVVQNMPRTNSADTGSFSQRVADGVHTRLRTTMLTFSNISTGEKEVLRRYCEAHSNDRLFVWQTYLDGPDAYWTISGWSSMPIAPGIFTVQVSLEERVPQSQSEYTMV